ncbi:MAG: putative quinol monooxygenase [Betaproteobacteria bacterium]
MYVVTVDFTMQPENATRFRVAMVANARTSREVESGCLQFDVCALPGDPATIFLYEVYKDRAAFDAHLAAPHFRAFDETVRDWITGKVVRTYERVDP